MRQINYDHLKNILDEMYRNIVLEASVDSTGVSWETVISVRGKGVIEKGVSHSILNGNAGIILFLIEYYTLFPAEKLKELIKSSLLKSYSYYLQNHDEIGFYSGRGGLIYILVRASEVFPESGYTEQAESLTLLPFPDNEILTCNIDTGVAGYILGALHAYTATGNNSILKRIRESTSILVSAIKIRKEGVYWDELNFSSKPLCSFLYGNSGIIFVLLELKKILKTTALDKIIREAFAWEDQFYNSEFSNWPDHYHEYGEIVSEKAINDLKYESLYVTGTNTFGWHVGSPGTLLARIHDLNSRNNYKRALKSAHDYLVQNSKNVSSNFTLYNGVGGVCLTLSNIDPALPLDDCLQGLISQKRKFNYFLSALPQNNKRLDLSLFNGETGIAYLLLQRIFKRDVTNSILRPTIDPTKIDDKSAPAYFDSYTLLPLQKIFKTSSLNVEKNLADRSYYELATDQWKMLETKDVNDLDVLLSYEQFKLMQYDLNFFLESLREQDVLMPKKIRLNTCCRIVSFHERKFLLMRRIGYIQVIELSDAENLLLSLCMREDGIERGDLLNFLVRYFQIEDSKDEEMVRETMSEQITSAIKSRILIGAQVK